MKTRQSLIVCGTDFSVPATQAAQVAAALAKQRGGKLLLVHAATEGRMWAEPPEIGQGLINTACEELRRAAQTLRKAGTEVEEAFLFGAADKALLQLAAARKADLLVVGAVGRTRHLLTGSVAVRVAEGARIPTLVVRQGQRLTNWVEGGRTLHVLVGDDFSAAGDAALRQAADLSQRAPCSLAVVHANWPPEDRRRLHLRGPLSLTQNDPEVQRVLEEKLTERTRAFLGEQKCALRVAPCWGRVDSYLLMLASEMDIDLLLVGTHQRRGMERFRLGSVSRTVLHDALVTVLVVPLPVRASRSQRSKGRIHEGVPALG